MEELRAHKEEIEAALLEMTKMWRKEMTKKYTTATVEVLDSLIEFLNRGGKRIRGSLAMESYYLHGGSDKKVALGAACVMELVQAYLLIMDDIQDKSVQRRGGPTVHVQLAKQHGEHYGIAQALNAEMLANHQAMTELLSLPVANEAKLRAAKLLNKDISVTIAGQINDIYNQVAKDVASELIIDTMIWKTAYYTFISPIELGACLAGKQRLGKRLYEYAINAGIAFQIVDDVLGTFGTVRESGKSIDDDIQEGKRTLLVAYAQAHLSSDERQVMERTLGNSRATKAECDKVRHYFERSGARDYSMQQAALYAGKSEGFLKKSSEDFFRQAVDFSIRRTM